MAAVPSAHVGGVAAAIARSYEQFLAKVQIKPKPKPAGPLRVKRKTQQSHAEELSAPAGDAAVHDDGKPQSGQTTAEQLKRPRKRAATSNDTVEPVRSRCTRLVAMRLAIDWCGLCSLLAMAAWMNLVPNDQSKSDEHPMLLSLS